MLRTLLSGNFSMQQILAQIMAVLVVIFLILPFHEWAHAVTASLLGDKGIKARGRLSLNPISHIDPIGALMLLLVGFGWAKPVPVDPRYFKHPKLGMGITALMGPVANLLAAFAGLLAYNLIGAFAPDWFYTTQGLSYEHSLIWYFLRFYIEMNVFLAVFNLIPVPPLDGSKVLFVFLPDSAVAFFYRYQNVFYIALFVLMYAGALNGVLSFISSGVLKGMSWLAALPFGG